MSLVLKCLAGLLLLAWMISTGMLNPARVAAAMAHWPEFIGLLALFYAQVALTSWRWNLLLAAQEISLSFRDALSLTMIGALFSTVLPSTVGGDVVKGYYVARRASGRTSQAINTILMDRIVGLLGLIWLACAAALWNFGRLREHPALMALGLLAVLGSIGGTAAMLVAVLAGRRFIPHGSGAGRLASLARLFSALHAYRERASVLPAALAVSMLVQAFACIAFYLAARSVDPALQAADLFFLVVPLGLVTLALPVSPAGIGVGQAAFFALFKLVPGTKVSFGADAFTMFQCGYLLVYLTGLYFYLAHKEQAPTPAEAQRSLS